MKPAAACDWATTSHRRLETELAGLTDDQARQPSTLPDWSVGHVLTHIARNGDSHVWMAGGFGTGEARAQYPHGIEGRNQDIEDGSGRSAAELVADVAATNAAIEAAWAELTDEQWLAGRANAVMGDWQAVSAPFFRQREVEIHRIDLGLGATCDELPAPYVGLELEAQIAGLPRRSGAREVRLRATDLDLEFQVASTDTDGAQIEVEAEGWRLVGWIFGRLDTPDLPALTPWP